MSLTKSKRTKVTKKAVLYTGVKGTRRLEKRTAAAPSRKTTLARIRFKNADAMADKIASLNDTDADALKVFLDEMSAARKEEDAESVAYIKRAIAELFRPAYPGDRSVEEWMGEIARTPTGAQARAAVERSAQSFFKSYRSLKAKAGLTTIEQVAKAAGISPTTVHQLENQAVKPQFRTIVKLAKAFHVDCAELMGDD